MKTVLNYNFKSGDIEDGDYSALYCKRRRDSIFAFVYEEDDAYYCLRDHIGIVPLFYLKHGADYVFSTNLSDLPHTGLVDPFGLKTFLALKTAKIFPLFESVKIVPPGSVLRIDPDGKETILYEYKIRPQHFPALTRFEHMTDRLDAHMRTAFKRQLQSTTSVGLYLSGGIDSGLIGFYLKEMGIEIQTFSAITLKDGSERSCIEQNIEHLNPSQAYRDYVSERYEDLAKLMLDYFLLPHGGSTALAIASLWKNTPLSKQEQIFGGQNSDVINNAMDNNHFFTFAPLLFKKISGSTLRECAAEYLVKETRGLLTTDPSCFSERYENARLGTFQYIAIAGMHLLRTPGDSEMLIQSSVSAGIPFGNPYYDMDIVEFLLGLRIMHKIRFGKHGTQFVSLDKRIMQNLALRSGLPKELIYRKRGFTVSRDNKERRRFFENLPKEILGVSCQGHAQRFPAYILQLYAQQRALNLR